ncbi:ATP-binding protein [Ruminococcus sp. CLA-AA-H200]|uniref:ATP-binding protein n=1 Tax=Ruminococcus turbiniformis TaxID=2881258 RepID=A0ABS8G3M3_9FIRM|nr:ATP-binding protein [Ruminococcus turbiniformis]MCC2255982.1 ATP-binding protein [Ruminococcus turbiniformis]
MNDLDRRLIEAVCRNDLQSAKKIVKIILEQDKTQKNRMFVNRYLTMLNNSAMNLMELPADLKNLLIMEDVSVSFNENRYYLSNRENEIVGKILKLYKASQRLAEIGVNYINSTILYGESGTGKTTFGRYVAYKMGVPFAYLNFSRVVDSYLGSTQKNISKVFDHVKQQKCVFMIDEIDAIGMRRRDSKEVGEMSRIVISLMQNLDTLTSDVVLLGATNRLDIIDEALLRRFTTKHEVKKLNEQERYEMASKFLADVDFDYEDEWLVGFCERDNTQAGLMNELVEALVERYVEDE